jgi:hypothetical protein
MVTFGSAVGRTPACSVICGTGVGRRVGARVGDGVGPVAAARAVGGAVLVGGGVVGVTVRIGSVGVGVGVGVGDGSAVGVGFSATGGCSGALGFLGCASA